ncbi:unnamed protein product, partial [Diplocarpon coronariae]
RILQTAQVPFLSAQ